MRSNTMEACERIISKGELFSLRKHEDEDDFPRIRGRTVVVDRVEWSEANNQERAIEEKNRIKKSQKKISIEGVLSTG